MKQVVNLYFRRGMSKTALEILKANIGLIILALSLFSLSHSALAAPNSASSGKDGVRLIIKKGSTDITKKTWGVYAGQKMYLVGSTSNGAAMTNKSWVISTAGKPIADWNVIWDDAYPILTSASVDNDITLNQAQVNFYWLKAAAEVTVTFYATVNGESLYTYSKFNITRPAHSIDIDKGTVYARTRPYNSSFPDYPAGKAVGYGDITAAAVPGVTFTATFPNSTYGGSVQWVQIINSVTWTKGATPGGLTTPGLDVWYPYGTGTSTNDSPGTYGLAVSSFSRVDSFTMYLMWQPPGPNSIFIPLRLVNWGWWGSAADNTVAVWTLQGGNGSTPTQAYTDDPPEWTRNSNPPPP